MEYPFEDVKNELADRFVFAKSTDQRTVDQYDRVGVRPWASTSIALRGVEGSGHDGACRGPAPSSCPDPCVHRPAVWPRRAGRSAEGSAPASLQHGVVATCIAHDVNPRAYLHKIVHSIVYGWPQEKVRDLLPDRILAAHPELYAGDPDALPIPNAPRSLPSLNPRARPSSSTSLWSRYLRGLPQSYE